MNKETIAWIVVRAFGVYFCAQALIYVLYIASDLTHLSSLYYLADIRPDRAETEIKIFRAWTIFGFHIFQIVVFSLFAYYFLRRGKFFHNLLMYQRRSDDVT